MSEHEQIQDTLDNPDSIDQFSEIIDAYDTDDPPRQVSNGALRVILVKGDVRLLYIEHFEWVTRKENGLETLYRGKADAKWLVQLNPTDAPVRDHNFAALFNLEEFYGRLGDLATPDYN